MHLEHLVDYQYQYSRYKIRQADKKLAVGATQNQKQAQAKHISHDRENHGKRSLCLPSARLELRDDELKRICQKRQDPESY